MPREWVFLARFRPRGCEGQQVTAPGAAGSPPQDPPTGRALGGRSRTGLSAPRRLMPRCASADQAADVPPRLKTARHPSKVRSPRALVRRLPQRFGTRRGCGSPGLEPDRPRPPPAPVGGELGRPICLWRVCSSCHTPGKLIKALRRYS